jgi:S-methylmethionine-dependent homocysteine/selenocysteine methylase
METADTAKRETEDETMEECLAAIVAHMAEVKPLVLLQVNCRSMYNTALDFWNLINTYDPDVIGTK